MREVGKSMQQATNPTTGSSKQVKILGLDPSHSSFVHGSIFNISDINSATTPDMTNIISEFCKEYPQIDFILKFEAPQITEEIFKTCRPHSNQGLYCLTMLPENFAQGVFIGGSTALHYLSTQIKGILEVNWTSNDVDIFYLNCPVSTRMPFHRIACDMVFCKEKTIEEVLLNFDIPCCRVGFDFKYNFYVSIQALNSILTKKVYLPNYLSTPKLFEGKLSGYGAFSGEGHGPDVTKTIIKRFYERIKKYQSRGFQIRYVKNDYLLPWMVNRFTYVDFTTVTQNSNSNNDDKGKEEMY